MSRSAALSAGSLVLRARPEVVLRQELDDAGLLFDPDSGETFGLNAVGMRLWQLLDGHTTVAELAAIIRGEWHEVPASVEDDVRTFLETLVTRRLAEWTEAAGAEGLPRAPRLREAVTSSPPGALVPDRRDTKLACPPLMRSPRSVDLAITSRCNLSCAYCSHQSSPAQVPHELPTVGWLEVLAELERCAVMEVTLEGAEPCARGDLSTLIDGLVRHRLRFSLLTNGTLVTAELAAHLAATGRCNGVQVSIDGPAAAVHDVLRGPGSFERAVTGVRLLLRHDLPVTARVTIHRENVAHLEETAAFLLDDLGLPAISTNAASYLGRNQGNASRTQLTVAEQSRAMVTLRRLQGRYPDRITALAGPLAYAETWLDLWHARRTRRSPRSGEGYLSGCGGVFSTLAVRADGMLLPCLQLPHLELGPLCASGRDATPPSLVEIWQGHPTLRQLRARRSLALCDHAYCRGCDFVDYCTGSCPALAHALVGEVDHPSPEACLRDFLAAGGTLPLDE